MTQLTLAKPEHLETVQRLVADFHAEQGITQDDAARQAAIQPILDGSPYGAIYLAGPARAPIGYLALSFSWSLEFGGLDAAIDELYIRPAVRGRGIATEMLINLPKTLAGFGLRSICLEVDRDNEKARKLYEKLGFTARENYVLMARKL